MSNEETTTTEAQLQANKRWYERNGDTLNERRRERYHSDPAYRAQAQAQARRYKQSKSRGQEEDKLPFGLTTSLQDALAVIKDADSEVKTHQSIIIRWSNDGFIPNLAKYKGRYYLTNRQVKALTDFLISVKGRKQIFTSTDPTLKIAVSKLWRGW